MYLTKEFNIAKNKRYMYIFVKENRRFHGRQNLYTPKVLGLRLPLSILIAGSKRETQKVA